MISPRADCVRPRLCRRALYSNYQSAGATRSPAARRPAGSEAAALTRQASNAGDGNKQQQDLVKTANLLFGALEPHYVWHYMKVDDGEPKMAMSREM